jgi:hypothetical protein
MKIVAGVILFIGSQLAWAQMPGIEIQPHGLMVDTAYYSVGDNRVNENTFPMGTKLYLNLSGVHGFAIKDGKSFPGCSMKIFNASHEAILEYDDLFSSYTAGVDNKDARYLNVYLSIGTPMMGLQSLGQELKKVNRNDSNA